jgi:hypothetical protein
MEFQHAKMTIMAELDNNIRYYRSGILKIDPIEQPAVNQLIRFMTACKKLDVEMIMKEKETLRETIGNLLYDSLEAGSLSRDFTIIWTTIIHQTNMFFNKCVLLCELMQGGINGDEYKAKEKEETKEMIGRIQDHISLEILEDLVTP